MKDVDWMNIITDNPILRESYLKNNYFNVVCHRIIEQGNDLSPENILQLFHNLCESIDLSVKENIEIRQKVPLSFFHGFEGDL